MNSANHLVSFKFLLLCVLCGQSSTAHAATRPPNVIFIFADDLGWGDLGCYGNRDARTPRLDRLAREGTLFTQFYVSGSVCSPSRAAVMTGRFPAELRIHTAISGPRRNRERGVANYLPPSVPTVTRLFNEAGYAVGHFGKWHLGAAVSNDKAAPPPEKYGIDRSRTTGSSGEPFPGSDEEFYWANLTGQIVDETIRFAEENRDKPFYINVWTLLTHAALHPTEEQIEPFLERFAPQRAPYRGANAIYLASLANLDTVLMNPDGSRLELYDIPSDPSEMTNQAAAREEVVGEMKAALLEWHGALPEGPYDEGAGRADYPWPGPRR